MKCPFDKKDESCFYRHPTTKDCSLDKQAIVCPDYLETLPCKGRLSSKKIKMTSVVDELIQKYQLEEIEKLLMYNIWHNLPVSNCVNFPQQAQNAVDAMKYVHGHYHVGIDMGKEMKMETKTYPHKFFVQFSRNWFSVKSGKMLQYKNDDGKEYSVPETIFNRLMTFCVINPIDTAEYYEGMSVLNPKDHQNDLVGAKEAFQRAVGDFWSFVPNTIPEKEIKKIFFDAFLKKNFTSDNILSNGGFVLKVRLPWENKRR